jgi:ferric-dicitrate binding protein FerR (iron transport regulator)
MSSEEHDYLWDGSGPADADVARLERALGGLKHTGAPPELPAKAPKQARRRTWLAIPAGALAIAAALILYLALRHGSTADSCGGADGYRFDTVAGVARCGDREVARGTLPVGGWLETSADGAAELDVADIGHVRLLGDSRLGLVASGPHQQRLSLARGALHAKVTAPPRLFVVDTPAATAIDLGCEYDLRVAPDGRGTIVVTHGQVELAGDGHLSVVPAGATARLHTRTGPGTPVRSDAPAALTAAVTRLDDGDRAALDEILAQATFDDAITLFNLFDRVDAAGRARVYDRLDAIAQAPPGVTRDKMIQADPGASNAWREDLRHRDYQIPTGDWRLPWSP